VGNLTFTGEVTSAGIRTVTAETITFTGQLVDTLSTEDSLTLNIGSDSVYFNEGIGTADNPFENLTVNSGPAYLTGSLYVRENANFPQGLVLLSAAGETVSLTSNTGEIHIDDGLTVENAVYLVIDAAGGAYLLNGIGAADSPTMRS